MDIAKEVDAHILVIPKKKHCKNILDCDEETLSVVSQTVKTILNHLTENCGYEGVNLLNASDENAGQSAPISIFMLSQEKEMMEQMHGAFQSQTVKNDSLPRDTLIQRIKGDHATVIKLLSKEPLRSRKALIYWVFRFSYLIPTLPWRGVWR